MPPISGESINTRGQLHQFLEIALIELLQSKLKQINSVPQLTSANAMLISQVDLLYTKINLRSALKSVKPFGFGLRSRHYAKDRRS